MTKFRGLGDCVFGLAFVAGVMALGYGALSLICEKAMIVAGLN